MCVSQPPPLSPVRVSCMYALYCYICMCFSAVDICTHAIVYSICMLGAHCVPLPHIYYHYTAMYTSVCWGCILVRGSQAYVCCVHGMYV